MRQIAIFHPHIFMADIRRPGPHGMDSGYEYFYFDWSIQYYSFPLLIAHVVQYMEIKEDSQQIILFIPDTVNKFISI